MNLSCWPTLTPFIVLTFAIAASQSEPPCSQPKEIDHGTIDWDGKGSFAKYACYQGYHLVGPPSVECRYGSWYSDNPAVYPTCKPIVCNYPSIQNGHLETGDNVRYRTGQQATIECGEGFEIRNGNGKIICKEDGSWEPLGQKDLPQCKEKGCEYPDPSIPVIENGSLEINGHRQGPNSNYKPGSVALYHCHSGFVLLPFSADKRVCRRGKWEGTIPSCVSPNARPVPRRSHCPSPKSIPNGYYVTDTDANTPLALPVSKQGQYERGTIARYHCQDGYIMRKYASQDTYRCMANGDWSPKVPPVCMKLEQNTFQDPLDEVMCPSPTPIPNTDFERMEGWLTSNGAMHGTVLEYSCSIGYRDSRTPCLPTRRTCHAGQWVGNMPSCVPFDFCERPPSISHGFMVTAPENVYRIWTEIYYECHPGYKMKGINSLKCHPTGCWTPNDLPQCVREDLLDSGWSDSDSSSLPLVISLVTVSTGLAVIALFTTSCLVVLCRRKGGPVPPPSGPAHWSTTVTVTPECRPRSGLSSNDNHMMRSRHEQDRMALIAFADGMQQVTLPSYEEALRDAVNINHTNGSGNSNNNDHVYSVDSNSSTSGGGVNTNQQQMSALPVGETVLGGTNSSSGFEDQHSINNISTSQTNPSSTTMASQMFYTNTHMEPKNMAIPTSCTNTHPHYGRQGRYNHGNGSSNGRPNGGVSSRSRSRGQHGDRGHRSRDVVESEPPGLHTWSTSGNGNGRTGQARGNNAGRRHGGAGSSVSSGGSPREHDALSDTVSHHSVSSAGVNWASQRQPSQTASIRSGSAASVDNGGVGMHAPSILSKEPSENTLTTTESAGGNSSQTPSCRALAGSLASFDTSSIINTDGVPLLEENEIETEGSNSSEPGDTGSATYSETSNKA